MIKKGKFLMDETLAQRDDKLSTPEATRLVKLEGKVEKAVAAAGKIAGEALAAIRDERLYRLTHSSFDAYVLERFGFSRATAYRMIGQSKPSVAAEPKLARISASAEVKPQVNVSHGETVDDADPIPATSTEAPPDQLSEGVEQDGETRSVPRSETPSDGVPEGAGVTVGSLPPVPSGPPDGVPPTIPTVKQLLRTLHTLLDEIDPTEAFNVESEDERERHAQWIKRYRSTAAQEPSPAPATRRQGTVSRPEDRSKAKLEVVPVDPATCDHPKEKRKKLAYGNLCERCGRMVA